LDNGRIIQRGTHAELLAQPGTYQQIYNLQARIEAELEMEIASADNTRNGNGRTNGHFHEELATTVAIN